MNIIKAKGLGIVAMSLLSWLCGAGCDDSSAERFFKTGRGRFLSPDKPILQPDEAQVNWIIQSMGELDKTEEIYPDATRPGPEDWIYADSDYIIGPTDVLGISIQDLYYEGVETTLQREVSESGYIDLPLLRDRIKAEGLTAVELTRAIEQAYSPAVIKDSPIVSVSILMRRKQMFSVLGAVMKPGTYQIPRPDMRVLEAMAMCGGTSQPNIEYIYVIRSAPPLRSSQQEAKPPATESAPAPATEPAPAAPAPAAPTDKGTQLKNIGDLMKDSVVTGPTSLETLQTYSAETFRYSETAAGDLPIRTWAPFSETASVTAANEAHSASAAEETPQKTLRWIYRDGQWVQQEVSSPEPSAPERPESKIPAPADSPTPAPAPAVPAAPTAPAVSPPPVPAVPAARRPAGAGSAEDPFGWAKAEKKDQVRIIALNLKKLEQGDYRQNIVIRENDIIQVPPLEIGEFFVMGEVLRPGAYSLTGRQVTIKMALASAGNLGPLAWPENSVLIRRIGKNQEQIIPIHIESILRGTEPDIYLKPNDIIAVGTHWSTSFLAVMRNAFRMTYGFGFIYDRNFADPLYYYPNSKRFKGW